MPWYRTGTISVTNGSTTVTGSGTSWVTNALTGEGLQAPDGRVYEIASITSATQLTLASAYLGANQTGQTYAILPTHTFAKDLASEVSALVVDYQTSKSDFDAGSFSKGTTAAPGINFGVDGQSNTGFTNETTGEIGISIAGTNRGKITATGLNGAAIGATTAAAGTFTNLTANTTLVVPGATTPAQTAEGSVVWDTDSDLLTVGTGAGRKTMVDTDSTQTLTNKTLTNPVFSGATANMGTVTTIDINGGTIDGTTIGGSTAAAGTFTTLNTTGNVTLGDASTDTVTVNGFIGVGGFAVNSVGVYVSNTNLLTVNALGFASEPTANAANTSQITGFYTQPKTAAAVFTVANSYGVNVVDASKGAGSTITNQHGLRVSDQTQGANNYGITSLVSSGSNKWNIYASGTAANYFAGNVQLGAVGTPTSPIHILQSNAASNGSNGLTIEQGSTGDAQMHFLLTGVQRYTLGIDNSDSDKFKIGTNVDLGTSNLFTLDSSGNVGIGTSAPASELEVLSTDSATAIRVTSGAASTTTGTSTLRLQSFNSASGVIGSAEISNTAPAGGQSILTFSTSPSGNAPTERLRIDSLGNVNAVTSLTEASSPVVVQTDIGTAPNEIPLNQYLGEMAYMNADQIVIHPVASVAPIGIGDMVFQLTNDTTLVIKVKGSDGVVRSNTLTLA